MICEQCELKEDAWYADEDIAVAVPPKPTSQAHLMTLSGEHGLQFENLDPKRALSLLKATSLTATAIFEGMQAQGTNILIDTGSVFEDEPHVQAHIVGRFPEDGLELQWPREQAPDSELAEMQRKIKDKIDTFGLDEDKTETVEEQQVEKRSDARIASLRRIP